MALDAGSVLLYQLIPGAFITALLCLVLSRATARRTNALLRAPLLSYVAPLQAVLSTAVAS